jgi:hypothetical protein
MLAQGAIEYSSRTVIDAVAVKLWRFALIAATGRICRCYLDVLGQRFDNTNMGHQPSAVSGQLASFRDAELKTDG